MGELSTIQKFQQQQRDIVIQIGAYLSPIKEFIDQYHINPNYAEDINAIRQLISCVENDFLRISVLNFLGDNNIMVYYIGIATPYHGFNNMVSNQLMPSQKRTKEKFIEELQINYDKMSEGMMVFSQIPLPQIDVTLKAACPFQAFMFFTNLFESISDCIYIIDPWFDASIFYRYLFRLPTKTKIRLLLNSSNWKDKIRKEFKSAEQLFSLEYPNYIRRDDTTLHDRYIITNRFAYSLGGSIKDAAKKADYLVVQLTEEKRIELINKYFTGW